MYRILGADQQEYGPASVRLVRQWIVEKRINAQTRVKLEGTAEWRPIGELPEFSDVFSPAPAAVPPDAPPPVSAREPLPPAPPRTGLALASLVLGIVSLLCGGLLLGIPAIIMGHVAHNRARRSPDEFGGAGFAIAGFVTGYCSVVATVLMLGIMLPALAKAKEKAEATTCVSHLKQIALGARLYALDHRETFPPNYLSMSNVLTSPKILVCPKDASRVAATDWPGFSSAQVSYEYLLPNAKESEATRAVVFRCPFHGHRAFGDGSVQEGSLNSR
jgi:hypothetical protein